MTNSFKLYFAVILFSSFTLSAQNELENKKIKIRGTIVEKASQQPLEYATITFINQKNPKRIGGGITNASGKFETEIGPGIYTIKAEFISFKSYEKKDVTLTDVTDLGIISLEEDFTQLNQIDVRGEITSLDIKLDKKVYNVGKDLIVKGGTITDVLDNIPSVAVDGEGNISLRGNENVRILIDGRPTNAANISEALRLIPADAIDKVEVITNPSARYDAEGGGGILNIILKIGKNQGVSGSFIVNVGTPENTGASLTLNSKNEFSNFFATLGYAKRNAPGNMKINQENFDSNNNLLSYIEERRNNNRRNEGINGNFGMELFFNKSSSWVNALNFRKNDGTNRENVFYSIYEEVNPFSKRNRFNDLNRTTRFAEYTSNFIKRFKKDGHKFSIDAAFSVDTDSENSAISGSQILPDFQFISSETTKNKQRQNRNLIQSDYIVPLGSKSQFETGIRGNYVTLLSRYQVEEDLLNTGNFTNNVNFTNTLEYKEYVSSAYVQFGSKIRKISYLVGLRFEDSQIEINQLVTQDFNSKKYNNLFPSAFLTYEINASSSVALNYSKRISRPRDRFINPFSSYSSNTNLFVGNPDLDPSLTDAYDLGFLKKWNKLTLNTSIYLNQTAGTFQIVRKERGDLINDIPVILNTPFNLAQDDRIGFEFTLNYTPYKWWKLNGNFNYFSNKTSGNYTYTKTNNQQETINFDNISSTWFTRITSKFNLPKKIDLQINGTYNGQQQLAQGKTLGVGSLNAAISKDFWKDKATITLNAQDIFNSKKRINDLQLTNFNSFSEMQWRERQITLSLTYRFNKKKTDREKAKRDSENNEDY